MASSLLPDTAPSSSEIFQSSRWTAGNLIFPDRLVVTPRGLMFRKRGWFSSREEEIPWEKIASVSVARGILFAMLIIETTGGSRPIEINGLGKGRADHARELIAAWQGRGSSKRETPFPGNGESSNNFNNLETQAARQVHLLEEMISLQKEILGELRRR